MTAVASLESGQAPARPAGPSAVLVAAYVAGGALIMASFALLAGFYNLRNGTDVWPPEGVDFDEYLSVMLSTTILMAASLAGWASSATRLGNRRQAIAALVMTVLMGAAFLNLAWYTGSHSDFGPSSHPFGAVVISSLAVTAAAVVAGLAFLAVALLRTLLRAERASDATITAAARFWFLVVAAWMVSPVALYGLMSAR